MLRFRLTRERVHQAEGIWVLRFRNDYRDLYYFPDWPTAWQALFG
jgi:hypothetical protein